MLAGHNDKVRKGYWVMVDILEFSLIFSSSRLSPYLVTAKLRWWSFHLNCYLQINGFCNENIKVKQNKKNSVWVDKVFFTHGIILPFEIVRYAEAT